MRGEKAADVVAGVDPVAGETPSFECYILVPETGDSRSLLSGATFHLKLIIHFHHCSARYKRQFC